MMAADQLDRLKDITDVLTLLAQTRRDPDDLRDVAHALALLQDVSVALHLGMTLGLPLSRIAELVPSTLDDEGAEVH